MNADSDLAVVAEDAYFAALEQGLSPDQAQEAQQAAELSYCEARQEAAEARCEDR